MQIAPPPPNAFLQMQTSRIIEGRTITPYDYRAVAIPLYVTLSASNPRGSSSYTIPTNMRFRPRQLIPHIVLPNPSSTEETFTNDGAPINAPNGFSRLYMKAMNCRVSLAFQSRAFEVMPNLSFPLSDLMAQNGGQASFLDMPGSILQGSTLDLNAGLMDTNAAFSPTEYGIILIGSFVRVE